ncbi:YfgM family protein [Adhaeribacter radiodurans]|uniref:Tetratricopeptide repeat protein n=1 Tax=Adhaeribacter radiodurans TaxID=2745197 RepID=A0A7L7LBG6_9BACT|nr:hypothetical protein [Adhaeribacter radiodurans]QMU30077.1 hypothetical protein HUW48_19505 [Adhaeribacter radiodurans]
MAEQNLLGSRRKGSPFLFYVLLTLGLVALGLAIYHYFTGSDYVITWQPQAELHPVSATLARFTDLFQTFLVPVTGFLVSERFDVGLPTLRPELAAIYLGILSLTLAVYFTIVSTFPRLPYIVAMTLVMLFLATCNFDLLRATPDDNQVFLILVLGILVLISYAFQAFITQASLWVRFLTFSGILIALAAFMNYSSQFSAILSAMQVVHYSSLAAFAATCLFIFLVSFENIHALLWLNTQGSSPQRRYGLWHFILIGILYLLNLLLLYLRNAEIIQLDFYYVDPFIILLLSTLVGYWGWKRRKVQYQKYFTFNNGAGYVYLTLGIISLLSIGYAFATVNTPFISAFTDVIVYTHLAYGFLFFLYILLNFYKLIQQRLAVYKVVFDPKQMPFYTVYLMGSLLLLALVFRSPFNIYSKAQSGYYNYLGDFYKATGNLLLAERFYTEGTVFSHHNLKSTYALAGLYRERSYSTAEINLLKDALAGQPSEKVYARLAGTQTDQKDFFNHLFLLNQGLRTFPNSTSLLTNKALLYETTSLVDSTEYLYQQALAGAGEFSDLVRSNLLAFYLKNGNPQQAVALAEQGSTSAKWLAWQSNLTLLNLLREQPATNTTDLKLPAKVLTPAEFALFYHNTLEHLRQSNAATIKRINQYLAQQENAPYAENLILLKGLTQFHAGQVNEARTTLENQALTSPHTAGFYYYLIGSWLMEQKLYQAAVGYFDKARTNKIPEAELPYLYALAHTPDKGAAYSAVSQAVIDLKEPNLKNQATFLANVLNLTTQSVLTASDSAKVAYLNLYRPDLSTTEFENVVNSLATGKFKSMGQRELARHYLQNNNVNAAAQTIQAALSLANGDKNLTSELNLLRADVLVKQGKVNELNKLLPTLTNQVADQNQKLFYQAVVAEKTNPQRAKTFYQQIPQVLIYNEDAVLAAANFFSRVLKNDNQAYDLLLSSIKYNPFSSRLYQAYVFSSIKLGFIDFAQTAAEELKNLLSPAEYANFQTTYEQKLKEKQAAFPGWD